MIEARLYSPVHDPEGLMLLKHGPRTIPVRYIPFEMREDDIQRSITRDFWVENALRRYVYYRWLQFSS
jgi:hypothetical protein